MTTKPSVSAEDGRLLPKLRLVYPSSLPSQRTGYSYTYSPIQDDLGKEKDGSRPPKRSSRSYAPAQRWKIKELILWLCFACEKHALACLYLWESLDAVPDPA
jgi:hypothetical protein